MRLARSQRRTGTRRPQRGSVGRVRLYNVTDDAVVDGPSQVVLGGRKVAIRRPRVRRAGASVGGPLAGFLRHRLELLQLLGRQLAQVPRGVGA